jgi:glucose uptake protein GlcU
VDCCFMVLQVNIKLLDIYGATSWWVEMFKRAKWQAERTESKEKKYCPWEKNSISNIPFVFASSASAVSLGFSLCMCSICVRSVTGIIVILRGYCH